MKYDTFDLHQIDAAYINSLVNLVNACRMVGVAIDKVYHFQNGWYVTFKGHDNADAACHDGSYDSPSYKACCLNKELDNDWSRVGEWETTGFPWDYNDVIVHSAEELALYVHALNNGTNIWEQNNEDS